ncbi:MAG: cbb3-type cytochrome c oxidase N-terminal domain-containing protein [Ferruginibacter sp.]
MNLSYLIKKKSMLSLVAILVSASVMAQNTTATTSQTVTSNTNQLAILLVVMTLILAFVIWGLGQVLVVLSRQVMEKQKHASSGKALTTILVLVMLFAAQFATAQKTAPTVVNEVPNYGGLSSTTFYFFVIVIVTEVLAVLFLAFAIRRVYTELVPEKEAATKKYQLLAWWSNLDKKIFTKAIPVEREADYLLDHNYDGIQELDNALPPWWKYGFYFTIVVAVIYLLNFHVLGNGKNPSQEYVTEMEKAKIEKDIFDANNKDKVDENNVPMADATGLAAAKEIFITKCKPCHGEQGQGGVGPNLTDDYWIHKGSLNDIFHTIKIGYADKGMQSWTNDFTPKEISFLASYVKSIHGTNPPNPKAPQGELYVETKAVTTATDSTKIGKSDSAAVKNTATVNPNKDTAAKEVKK